MKTNSPRRSFQKFLDVFVGEAIDQGEVVFPTSRRIACCFLIVSSMSLRSEDSC